MSRTNRFCLTARAMKAGLALALVLGLSGAFEPAYADPPPWAPAHGWRAKHKHKNKGKHKQHIRAERDAPSAVNMRVGENEDLNRIS